MATVGVKGFKPATSLSLHGHHSAASTSRRHVIDMLTELLTCRWEFHVVIPHHG